MLVEVRLFATFRQGRFKEKQMEFPEASSLADLLAHLQIAEKEARILLVNGIAVSPDHKLAPGDIVSIFPPMAGG
ncbi:MAG: MoaD/ThiS family protein [Phycisphaerae bacterium]|nr:MoaD/ThiS family protein [Phycisphaerae bacterium]